MINPNDWRLVIHWQDMGDDPDGNPVYAPTLRLVDGIDRPIITFEGNSYAEMSLIAAIATSLLRAGLDSLGSTNAFDWQRAAAELQRDMNFSG